MQNFTRRQVNTLISLGAVSSAVAVPRVAQANVESQMQPVPTHTDTRTPSQAEMVMLLAYGEIYPGQPPRRV